MTGGYIDAGITTLAIIILFLLLAGLASIVGSLLGFTEEKGNCGEDR